MFGQFAFFDQLIQDVFDLPSRSRCRIELFENALQVRATVRRRLDVLDEIVLTDLRLRPPACPLTARVLRPHTSSLLTSLTEEHRFGFLAEMAELADAL